MNTMLGSSAWRGIADVFGTFIGALVCWSVQAAGDVLSALLWMLEPLVRTVLTYLSTAAVLTAGLFYFAGSPSRHVSYEVLLGFAFGCVLILAAYAALLRLLERR